MSFTGKIVYLSSVLTDENEDYQNNEHFKNLQNVLNGQSLGDTYCIVENTLQKGHLLSFKRFSKEKNYSVYSNPTLIGFDSTLEGINSISMTIKSNYFIDFETFSDGTDEVGSLLDFVSSEGSFAPGVGLNNSS
jgi:hypothetical protein